MSQSEWIAAAILAGFLIYLAIKGKLATYWSFMTGGGTAAPASSTSSAASTASTVGSTVAGLAGTAAGPAATALPGVVSGTVTQGQQTTQEYFPMLANPSPLGAISF